MGALDLFNVLVRIALSAEVGMAPTFAGWKSSGQCIVGFSSVSWMWRSTGRRVGYFRLRGRRWCVLG